jgi:hypothetical protein
MFTVIPAAIVFVNNDLTDSTRDAIVKQLFITFFLTGEEFDTQIAANPNYADEQKKQNNRVMVIRSFEELQNREYADVVMFVKQAMISIEENKFGPPGLTMPIDKLTWGKLEIFELS